MFPCNERRHAGTVVFLLLGFLSPVVSGSSLRRLSFPKSRVAHRPKRPRMEGLRSQVKVQDEENNLSRRKALGGFLSMPLLLASLDSRKTARADSGNSMQVYFGAGCFWHIQHEFIDQEKRSLGRDGLRLTSLTGYAGGKSIGEKGRVCYHNMRQVGDYGRLGHAEVVQMTIPEPMLKDFATRYFNLFVKYDLPGITIVDRADPQDKGPEYRSLLGLPGGIHSSSFPIIKDAAKEVLGDSWKLVEGQGNEPDTLLKKTIYVMDSEKFPFHVAEMYHQFHNDFQSPPYGKEYNHLRDTFRERGVISETGCPEGMI